MKMLNNNPFTLKNFMLIFEYSHENSGQLMWHRFVNDCKRNEKAFINDLCDIDRAKFDKWVLNRLNHTKKCLACHSVQVGKVLTSKQ
jgi:hypothetical protein